MSRLPPKQDSGETAAKTELRRKSTIVMQAKNITRRLEGDVPFTLVDKASVEIKSGELTVITGPSGSGKSSLLYLLGLLDRPNSGSILLNGTDLITFSDDELADVRLAQLGFVFQFHFLLPEFTALENVTMPMKRLGKLSEQQIDKRGKELLTDFGLGAQVHKLPKQLSGGQSQRVAIARALANNPIMIFADEPTGNLDTASSANVQEILHALAREQNTAIVAVTHDPAFAKKADKAIKIIDGKVI